ncbi:MAG: VWA domain-containing protein [Chloracidobacterium sp.]|nr:VWA domain-containing protein [Chloracidobacterium sp.]
MRKVAPFVVLFMLCLSVFGQQQTPTPEASPNQDNDVVKITTKLVQLDLIVVDKDGNQVRNLTAADFTVLEDGKPQKITNLSYVNTEAGQSAAPAATVKEKTEVKIKDAPIAPPVKISPANPGRIITFIVDDGNCAASNIGMRASKEGLEKFIREQMQPTDMVAIYQTRSGSNTLQQYTNDKARLLKIAGKIRWMPPMGSCASNDGSFFAAAKSNTYIKQTPSGPVTNTIETETEKRTRQHTEDMAANNQIVGTLGVIRYVVQGLQRVPGRKIMFLLSDGLSIFERNGRFLDSIGPMKELTELANRSSVVINTMDVRGVFDEGMIEARDEVYAQDDILATNNIRDERGDIVSNSRNGLRFLARETGGKFTQNQNFLDGPIKKNLATETGYYLIGYEPSEDTFKGKKFNKIEIKVNQPDLKVVSRAGFFGVVEPTAKPKRKTEDSDLYEAIAAPLPRPSLDVKLSAYFVNSAEAGNVVRALFRINGSDLTFVDDKDGLKKTEFDVVAVTLNEKGKVVDEFTHGVIYKEKAVFMPTILKNGLIYSTDVIVKKPGTYNFRVAVKDTASKHIGTSYQLVEIPDLKKTGVFVSGLTVAQVDSTGKFTIPEAVKPEKALTATMTAAVPAIRRFPRGSVMAYAYTVYNAKLDPSTGQPKLSVQTKLYYNGELVMDSAPQSAQLEKQADWTRINDFGYLKLKPQMDLGDYSIQIIIKDLLADGKNAITSQSIDFEVVE